MLDQLEAVAQTLGMSFTYGDKGDLDEFARKNNLYGSYLLFHEGYFLADLNEDGQGALEFRHRLTLDLLAKSKPTDKPEDKRQHLSDLKTQLLRLYKQLKTTGQLSGARAVMGLNLTTSNLDAIQLTITVLPDAESLCNL